MKKRIKLKTMKKNILILLFLLTAILVKAQVTPTKLVRIANGTTAFGNNLAIGTMVYNIAQNKTFVVTAGIASTETITTASASLHEVSTIVDNTLTSTSTTTALSAAQGKVLQDTKVDKTLTDGNVLIGNATDIATGVALSGDISLTNAGAVTVNKIDGTAVDMSVAPTANQVLKWNGSAWKPETQSATATGADYAWVTLATHIPANASFGNYYKYALYTVNSVDEAIAYAQLMIQDFYAGLGYVNYKVNDFLYIPSKLAPILTHANYTELKNITSDTNVHYASSSEFYRLLIGINTSGDTAYFMNFTMENTNALHINQVDLTFANGNSNTTLKAKGNVISNNIYTVPTSTALSNVSSDRPILVKVKVNSNQRF